MAYQLKDRLRRFVFRQRCKAVLRTAPVTLYQRSNLTVLSQVQHKDVLMFLLALKSFARRVTVGDVVVVDDGTLTSADRQLLARHVSQLTFVGLADSAVRLVPAAGCWERLLSIADRVEDRYVIQLDSDTLTLGMADEISRCIAEGRSFVIGTWDGQGLEPMSKRQALAAAKLADGIRHVQLAAEASFHRLRDFNTMQYVRGCAGFSGFAPGSFSRTFVEDISSQMSLALGAKWVEWGSEQVMSNIVVANSPKAMVLPHPKYSDCSKMRLPETVFVHFIGTCRFKDGTYARLARPIIRELQQAPTA